MKTILVSLAFAALLTAKGASAATVQVRIEMTRDSHFDPKVLTIHAGDTVQWIWADNNDHSVVSGDGNTGTANGLFNSGIHRMPFSFSHTFPVAGHFAYYCGVHRTLNIGGPWPAVNVLPAAASILGNISTRARVETGDNVLIGGLIISGTGAKQVLVRALGPTLATFGVSGALVNPVVELHNSAGALITSNDNWGQAANAQSIPANLRPPDSLESAILISLNPGIYSAVMRGTGNSTGVGLVEIYDLSPTGTSHLTNISSRGLVQTGDNVMIAGLVVESGSKNVLVRALGPTLVSFGISNALANPMLQLHDANGTLLSSNDNWRSTQQTQIAATGKAPANDLEAAILRTLAPGNYTAIVRGVNNTSGVALVEVYSLN